MTIIDVICLRKTPVEMSYGDDFAANVVIQSVHAVGVNEAIADPDTSFHTFLHFI